VLIGHGNVKSFAPKGRGIEAASGIGSHQKRDIEIEPSYRSEMLDGGAIGDLDVDAFAAFAEISEQFGYEPTGNRGNHADAKTTSGASPDVRNVCNAMIDFAKDRPRASLETFPGDGQANTAIVPLKQRRAEFIFEIADAAADRGFLNAQCRSGFAKAALVSRYKEISEMFKLKSG